MRQTRVLLTPVVLCMLCVPSASQQSTESAIQVRVKDVLAVMSRGTFQERQEMMGRVVALGVTAKSPEVRRVVANELARMNSVVEARRDELAKGIAESRLPDIGEYRGLLVQACSIQTDDDVVLEPLLGAIETGNMAQNAIARFGPKALDRVIEISNDDSRPIRVFCALETLSKMLLQRTLNQDQAARVTAIARGKMSSQHPQAVWLALVRLAVATGDADLRGKVASIAAGTLVPPVRGSLSPREAEQIRRVAQGALAGTGRKH